MSYCRKLIWLLALVILAGCATPAPRQPPPDVDLSPEQPVVTKPEVVAAPPPKPAPVPPIVARPAPMIPPDHIAPNETWVPLERWCQACGYGAPRRIADDVSPVYAFTLTNGTMTIRIGSQLATWRGVDFHLGFAPQLINGNLYVHALDIRKNFLPLLTDPVHQATNRVIVIDPGHGGTDSGTSNVASGQFEKDYSLDLARRLQSALGAEGWTALLTRTTDIYLPLSSRVAFADQNKASLFVSLHFNSSFPDRHETGLETYCLTPQGMRSTETRGYPDNPSLVFPNNHFDFENMQYAARVHRELLKVNGHADRGVKHARFLTVLRGQNRPAFLVEAGFMSNPTEARKIADPAYRQKLAEAIAHALEQETGAPVNVTAQVSPAAPSPVKALVQTSESGKKVAEGTNNILTNVGAGAQGDGND